MPTHFCRFNDIVNTVARTTKTTYGREATSLEFAILAARTYRVHADICIICFPLFKNISVSSNPYVMSPVSHVWPDNITIPFAWYQVVLLRLCSE